MDRQVIQAIKQRINIAEMVRRYVSLRPAGGRLMGLCPFHQEKTPSFSVNEAEGFFYCFGCQAGGDVLDFYQRVNGLEFKDALEHLAQEAGIELKAFAPDPAYDERQKMKRLCHEMHEAAQEYYRRNLGLAVGDVARGYLARRGAAEEAIAAFGLGASPDDWQGLSVFLRSRGFAPQDAVMAGLLSQNERGRVYDRFRGRLIFPIQNLSGQVIAFGGRILTEGEPKYLNSSDTPIYKKGEHLYGLFQARQAMTRSKRAILTEGYMDVLSLHQFGYTDSCGVLGTALTMDQVKRLAGFCSRMELIFDGDAAGRKAALRSAEMILQYGTKCGVVLMPDGEDVDSLLQKLGQPGLDACLKNAVDGLEYCTSVVRETLSPREIVAWANGFLAHLADNSLRPFYIPRLAEGLGIAEADLRRFGAGQGRQGGGGGFAPNRSRTDAMPSPKAPAVGREERDDRYFLRFAIQYPEYVPELVKRGFERLLTTDFGRALWEKLVAAQGTDVVPTLDLEEKSFWADTRSREKPEGEALAEEWTHVCQRIAFADVRNTREQLMEDIRRASQSGDPDEVKRLMAALTDLNAPSREEE
ncbi:DNA primase [Humidesulfovibrio mexicanus]|uniref:DNA primase n=1 Tax=Humidesulfovibrio mexicanus TaxID=147047 RepID=A0A239CZB6_9BACT|nr:DNA primase [Humidesulfovibrio mexicanus]SNS25098.1 DNA primase [Humidesulfovibrio mexicanus]